MRQVIGMSTGFYYNADVAISKIDVVYRAENSKPWKHGPRKDTMPEHSYCFMYMQRGGFYHEVEGRGKLLIPQGALMLKKYDRLLFTNTSADLPIRYLAMDFQTLAEIPLDFSRSDCILIAGEAAPQSEERMLAAHRLYTERPFGWRIRLRSITEELLLSFFKAKYDESSDALPPLIAESTALIRRRIFSGMLSVDEVAQECHVSSAHLIRSFGRYLGMTPKQYMDSLRVEMACDLLKYTGKSMEEIAELSGFSEARQMRRVFRKIMDVPPQEYREKQ